MAGNGQKNYFIVSLHCGMAHILYILSERIIHRYNAPFLTCYFLLLIFKAPAAEKIILREQLQDTVVVPPYSNTNFASIWPFGFRFDKQYILAYVLRSEW